LLPISDTLSEKQNVECREDNGRVGMPMLEITLGFHQIPDCQECNTRDNAARKSPSQEAVAFLEE